REMHDTVAQALAALVLQLEIVQTRLDSGEPAAAVEMLTNARTQARKGLEDTRRAVKGLSPASLEKLTTAQAIQEEVRRFEEETGVSARFVLTGEEQPLPPDQQVALLRITQEALTNARKHAQAQRVRVGLQFGAESILLLVEDDGVGFDLGAAGSLDTEGGYGLFGMNERARLLDGTLEIDSTPGWGTRIRATLPYRAASPLPSPRREGEGTPLSTGELPNALASGPIRVPITSAPTPDNDARIRVLIADDHAMMRQGIRAMLEADGETVVVGEAGDGAEAATLARVLRPDVVLMDLQMPGVDGIEGLKRIHADQPELPVVILTTFQNEESVSAALAAGARGFLLKDTEPANVIAAVQAARRGEATLSPAVTEQLAALASGQGSRTDAETLNDREREVLQLLALGARNKEIAAQLFITPRTVEYHLGNIFGKLGVSNRTEAARAALERGLVSSEPLNTK
ncbi:MAG TPA: hybrid sensor histidine kinase/response regulator transcription factor, partial [Chthonomonadaceae bacterium]|nr:hybrid sensor histidine kinase/response regulator transcription factor [Chthonomonadaceae bacterium]